MTRLELMELAEECSDVLAAMEDDLLQNIAEYLSEGRADIPTAQWKIRQLAALGKLDRKNIRTIAEYSGIAADMEEIAMTRAAFAIPLPKRVREGASRTAESKSPSPWSWPLDPQRGGRPGSSRYRAHRSGRRFAVNSGGTAEA